MHIVFLCGSLEPGRDGVGDYVRRLAAVLMQQGHKAVAVALNDSFVGQEVLGTQAQDGEHVPVCRLPGAWLARRRFGRARQWITDFNPTWVSLQYVPYAFQAKGVPLRLSQQLGSLVRGRQVHVMMHETWLGAPAGAPLRRQLLAWLQRTVVQRLLRGLWPAVVHTHLPTYQAQLAALGWQARPLPLFSNIARVLTPAVLDEPAEFQVGIFSQADNGEVLAHFLTGLDALLPGRVQVLLMGGAAGAMRALQVVLEEHGLRGRVRHTGFLEHDSLSAALQSCALGLTPVPRHGLGKSGSAAAFLAHGIAVAAPVVHAGIPASDVGFFSAGLAEAILLVPNLTQLATAQSAALLAPDALSVSAIARIFLDDLNQLAHQPRPY